MGKKPKIKKEKNLFISRADQVQFGAVCILNQTILTLNVVEIHLDIPVISLHLHERAEWTNLEGDVVKVLYIIGCVLCELKVDLCYLECQLHFNALLYSISETWRGRCRTLHGAQNVNHALVLLQLFLLNVVGS